MNWGTKIILGMCTFMLFIIGMVVYMFKVHGNDDLVEEDYYEKGINYNEEYTAKQNLINDNASPKITISDNQIIFQLIDSATYDLTLLRPSAKKDDLKLNGQTVSDSHLIIVDKKTLAKGTWLLNLKWTSNGKNYLYKSNLTL
jgi:nitrogen fixation protein FixH